MNSETIDLILGIMTALSLPLAVLAIAVTIFIYKRDKSIKRLEADNQKKQKTINTLAYQVQAYYKLEELLLQELSNNTGEKVKTMKPKYRDLIIERNHKIEIKNWLTYKEANQHINI